MNLVKGIGFSLTAMENQVQSGQKSSKHETELNTLLRGYISQTEAETHAHTVTQSYICSLLLCESGTTETFAITLSKPGIWLSL